jgi:putative endonuclease
MIDYLSRILKRRSPSPSDPSGSLGTREVGDRGEQLAADFLEGSGFRLVTSNFKISVGRNSRSAVIHAEIDIIAYEDGTLCFVEVKTRRSNTFAPPERNVDLRKQRQIVRAARAYRRVMGLDQQPFRYDVVSIVLPESLDTRPRVELVRNFWTEEKFRKRAWRGERPSD